MGVLPLVGVGQGSDSVVDALENLLADEPHVALGRVNESTGGVVFKVVFVVLEGDKSLLLRHNVYSISDV